MEQTEPARRRATKLALFFAFSRITLSSFGGALYWTRRELVDRLRWVSDREFVELLTIGQLLPGPNVLNLTVMVGNRLGGLTAREAEVLRWVAAGKSDAQIAAILHISARTVQKHLQHSYEKLGVESRTAAAMRANGRR